MHKFIILYVACFCDLITIKTTDKNINYVYINYRDSAIEASIAEFIITAIDNNKRVKMVLFDSFLESERCQYEFKTAHHRLLREKKNRIIMILLDEINNDKLDKELKLYLKTRTYVKIGDPWFWQKLSMLCLNECQ